MRDKFQFDPANIVPRDHLALQQRLVAFFETVKRSRTTLADGNVGTLRFKLSQALALVAGPGRTNAIHTALHAYEKAHLTGGGDWGRLRNTIRLHFGSKLELRDDGSDAVDVLSRAGAAPTIIGVIRRDDGRFELLPIQPINLLKPVFRRKGDTRERHYVYITHANRLVRRFVMRGLNGFDAMNVNLGQPLRAPHAGAGAQAEEIGGVKHGVALGTNLSEDQQILSHTRGWRKRYISTGVSARPAFSTRGTEFFSMYGAAIVDLAMVPDADIFDIHTASAASTVTGVAVQDVLTQLHHTGTNDLPEERYLALRDVIRTRELLIKGTIPLNALWMQIGPTRLLGIGSQTNNQHNTVANYSATLPPLLQAIVAQEEHQTFRDPHSGLKWHFIEFHNPVGCSLAFSGFVVGPQQVKRRFERVDPRRPPSGML